MSPYQNKAAMQEHIPQWQATQTQSYLNSTLSGKPLLLIACLKKAVDSHGDTLDFMLSERRDEDAATAFFKQASN